MWKRWLDIVGSLLFLLLTFPLWIVLALVVRCTSKGPIIYRSKRIGLSGKPFYMLKFRSMYIDADNRLSELWAKNDLEGPIFKMRRDPRITPVGRLLRKFSLDELPQFLNVLSGEMSLVGPRALHEYEVAKFDDYARERLSVKPGLTCYWQVMGRNRLSFEEWMRLDHMYMQEVGLMTDIRILFKTPKAVLTGDGAF
jgi:lipopolysaccharide/colanic/teichoic acid biosynthesis glycosyltransferase